MTKKHFYKEYIIVKSFVSWRARTEADYANDFSGKSYTFQPIPNVDGGGYCKEYNSYVARNLNDLKKLLKNA